MHRWASWHHDEELVETHLPSRNFYTNSEQCPSQLHERVLTDLCFAFRYCTFQTWDPAKCYDEISPQFIHGFLSWACDQRRGKGGRRRPGIKYASSLETFWKCYMIVYKIETGRMLDPMIQVNSQDVSLRTSHIHSRPWLTLTRYLGRQDCSSRKGPRFHKAAECDYVYRGSSCIRTSPSSYDRIPSAVHEKGCPPDHFPSSLIGLETGNSNLLHLLPPTITGTSRRRVSILFAHGAGGSKATHAASIRSRLSIMLVRHAIIVIQLQHLT